MNIRFDADAFERDFLNGAIQCCRFIGQHYAAEPFYSVALYADSYYTDCGIYFATNSTYRKSLAKGNYETKEDRWCARWCVGDWTYSSFGTKHGPEELESIMESVMKKWKMNQRDHEDKSGLTNDDWAEYADTVMRSACRVAVRLEADKAFRTLPRTRDFRMIVTDHDEAMIIPYLRLERFKLDGILLHSRVEHSRAVDPFSFEEAEDAYLDAQLARVLAAWSEVDV